MQRLQFEQRFELFEIWDYYRTEDIELPSVLQKPICNNSGTIEKRTEINAVQYEVKETSTILILFWSLCITAHEKQIMQYNMEFIGDCDLQIIVQGGFKNQKNLETSSSSAASRYMYGLSCIIIISMLPTCLGFLVVSVKYFIVSVAEQYWKRESYLLKCYHFCSSLKSH